MRLTYRRKVNFYETDAQGVVHHSNYPRYFEECRGYFLEQVGLPYPVLRKEYGVDVVLLKLNIEYLNPLMFGDEAQIKFSLCEIDSYFFSFEYIVLAGDRKVATGQTRHCCIKSDSRKVIKIPKILREKLEITDDR